MKIVTKYQSEDGKIFDNAEDCCERDSLSYGLAIRVLRIDTQCREWGQPYYAAHPTEGKQVEWTAKEAA